MTEECTFKLLEKGPPLPGVCYLKTPRDIRLGNADVVGYGDCKTNKYTCLSVMENCDWEFKTSLMEMLLGQRF
jgi:hypothetical protein